MQWRGRLLSARLYCSAIIAEIDQVSRSQRIKPAVQAFNIADWKMRSNRNDSNAIINRNQNIAKKTNAEKPQWQGALTIFYKA